MSEETKTDEKKTKLRNVPRKEWRSVWDILLQQARENDTRCCEETEHGEREGWNIEKPHTFLREHPTTKMGRNNCYQFLMHLRKLGLLSRIPGTYQWIVQEGEWRNTIPRKKRQPAKTIIPKQRPISLLQAVINALLDE